MSFDTVTLSVIMLNVVMLSVIMLNVVMLSALAPKILATGIHSSLFCRRTNDTEKRVLQ
jgi:hypothetical protein